MRTPEDAQKVRALIDAPPKIKFPGAPMTPEELVAAKWGQTEPSRRELAEAALYYYDQAYRWQFVAVPTEEKPT